MFYCSIVLVWLSIQHIFTREIPSVVEVMKSNASAEDCFMSPNGRHTSDGICELPASPCPVRLYVPPPDGQNNENGINIKRTTDCSGLTERSRRWQTYYIPNLTSHISWTTTKKQRSNSQEWSKNVALALLSISLHHSDQQQQQQWRAWCTCCGRFLPAYSFLLVLLRNGSCGIGVFFAHFQSCIIHRHPNDTSTTTDGPNDGCTAAG